MEPALLGGGTPHFLPVLTQIFGDEELNFEEAGISGVDVERDAEHRFGHIVRPVVGCALRPNAAAAKPDEHSCQDKSGNQQTPA